MKEFVQKTVVCDPIDRTLGDDEGTEIETLN